MTWTRGLCDISEVDSIGLLSDSVNGGKRKIGATKLKASEILKKLTLFLPYVTQTQLIFWGFSDCHCLVPFQWKMNLLLFYRLFLLLFQRKIPGLTKFYTTPPGIQSFIASVHTSLYLVLLYCYVFSFFTHFFLLKSVLKKSLTKF